MNSVHEEPEVLEVDVVVLGAGMSGLTAAARLAESGRRVCVLEAAAEIGGSAALSGGYVWTAASMVLMRSHNPGGDPERQQTLFDRFDEAIDYIRSMGVEVENPIEVYGFGRGFPIDTLGYLARCEAAVEKGDGYVIRNQRAERLLIDGNGGVSGVRLPDSSEISSHDTVIATGGFQASPELSSRFLGSDQGLLRSNPHSRGEGLTLALREGAGLSESLDNFYGHLVAWPLPTFGPPEFARFSQYYSDRGVLVSLEGRRFTEEWRGDHFNAEATLVQPEARALLVIDERVRADIVENQITTRTARIDRVAEARDIGAHVIEASTLDDLVDAAASWGYQREATRRTLARHLGEDAAGRPALREPLVAVEVRAAVTFTQGGLRVDGRQRVLNRFNDPIPGLWAVGADAGGLFRGGYAGGLAMATVSAMTASDAIAGRS